MQGRSGITDCRRCVYAMCYVCVRRGIKSFPCSSPYLSGSPVSAPPWDNFICQYESEKVIYLSVNSFSTQQQNNNTAKAAQFIALCLFGIAVPAIPVASVAILLPLWQQQWQQQCHCAFHLNSIMAINWWKWRSHSFQEGFEWVSLGLEWELKLAGLWETNRKAGGWKWVTSACHYSFKPGDWAKSVALPHNRQISPRQCVFFFNKLLFPFRFPSLAFLWLHLQLRYSSTHTVCGFRFVCDLEIQIVFQSKVGGRGFGFALSSRKFVSKTELLSIDKHTDGIRVCALFLIASLFFIKLPRFALR